MTNQITRNQYELLKSAVAAEARANMALMGIHSTGSYALSQDFETWEALLEWGIVRRVYGGELRPDASIRIIEEHVTGYDRNERVGQVQNFFETDRENAEQLTEFFGGLIL